MKIIVCGDWHLDAVIGGHDQHEDILKAVRQVMDATHGADLLVVGGDMFHTAKPSPRAVAAAIELLNDAGCPVVVLKGNHDEGRGLEPDALEPIREIGGWKGGKVDVVEFGAYMPLGGIQLVFVGHLNDSKAHAAGFASAQAAVDQVFERLSAAGRVLVFSHLDMPGAVQGTEKAFLRGAPLHIPINLLTRLHGVTVVNQHIHRQQQMGDVWMPGSVVPTDFSDDGVKGYMEIVVS